MPFDRLPMLPRELQIEVTGACNLRCHMCLVRYRPPLDRRQGSLSFATFRRLVDTLPDLREVVLQGLGEPLLAPDLIRMVEYAHARGIATGFNTNGTLLTRARAARLIRAGLDWLRVSLDGATAATYEAIREGASFARVTENIEGLVETRRRLELGRPGLRLVFVAMRRNVHELPALVRLAAGWGVEYVWVQNLSHSFSDTDPAGDYQEIRDFTASEALWAGRGPAAARYFEEARAVAHTLGVELRLPAREGHRGPRQAGTPGCDWPWRSAYVTHDGKVQPCCMVMGADRAMLGDLSTEDFPAIWRGAAYAEFRDGLLGDGAPPAVCRGCSMYRGIF
jgi:radical SAM protein with 4Fe4S-binding SPASM domain